MVTSAQKMNTRNKTAPRKRLSPAERQHETLEGAIECYSKFGFDASTRDLAEHLGISQSLIFRYFPTKSELTDRIYDVVFLNRWNPAWDNELRDTESSLEDRLKQFYRDYYHSIDRYEVIRISLFSALKGEDLSHRYMERVRSRLILPIVTEIRATFNLLDDKTLPISQLEEELVFSLHATIIYMIIRRHVFELPVIEDATPLIDINVENFISCAEASFRRAIQ